MGKVNTTDRVKKLIPVLGAMTSKELLTVMSLASGYISGLALTKQSKKEQNG